MREKDPRQVNLILMSLFKKRGKKQKKAAKSFSIYSYPLDTFFTCVYPEYIYSFLPIKSTVHSYVLGNHLWKGTFFEGNPSLLGTLFWDGPIFTGVATFLATLFFAFLSVCMQEGLLYFLYLCKGTHFYGNPHLRGICSKVDKRR